MKAPRRTQPSVPISPPSGVRIERRYTPDPARQVAALLAVLAGAAGGAQTSRAVSCPAGHPQADWADLRAPSNQVIVGEAVRHADE